MGACPILWGGGLAPARLVGPRLDGAMWLAYESPSNSSSNLCTLTYTSLVKMVLEPTLSELSIDRRTLKENC